MVSIIIPTWNTSAITQKCVATIKKFLPANFAEVIIVDNGSTDSTQSDFSKIKDLVYLRLDNNYGFGYANNAGAKIATAPYLFFLNSDMELLDDSLVSMVDYLQNHPAVGLIGPQFLNPDLTPQGSVFPAQNIFNAFSEFWLKKNTYSKYTADTNNISNVWAISGGAVLISKKLFQDFGGWDKRYFMYFEDLELCRQVRRHHLHVVYYPKMTVVHRHGASGAKLTNSSNQWRRLIPSSITYHGFFYHHLLNFTIWSGQKFHRLLNK